MWGLTRGDPPAMQAEHHSAGLRSRVGDQQQLQSNEKGGINPLSPVWFLTLSLIWNQWPDFKSGQVETTSASLSQLPLSSPCSQLPVHNPQQERSCLMTNAAPAWGSSSVLPPVTGNSTPKLLHSPFNITQSRAPFSLVYQQLFSTEKHIPLPIQLTNCASPFRTFSVDCDWQQCED